MRIFSANNKNPCAINLFTKIAPGPLDRYVFLTILYINTVIHKNSHHGCIKGESLTFTRTSTGLSGSLVPVITWEQHAMTTSAFPSPAADYIEGAIDLVAHLISHPSATYVLRTASDAMCGAAILPGIVTVSRQQPAAGGWRYRCSPPAERFYRPATASLAAATGGGERKLSHGIY